MERLEQLIMDHQRLDETSCAGMLARTAAELFQRWPKTLVDRVPFEYCTVTHSYTHCAEMQAEHLRRRGEPLHAERLDRRGASASTSSSTSSSSSSSSSLPEDTSSLRVLYLLLLRADAYDLCGYSHPPGLFTRGGTLASALLYAVAELPQTPVAYRARDGALTDEL